MKNHKTQQEHDITSNITLENKQSDIEGILSYEHDMKQNKNPGGDGQTAEFYQTFWPKIGNTVTEYLNEEFINTEMTITQKQNILNLIFKKGYPENIGNWRPISLLNIDYKIVARVLAKILQKVLPKIISMDQQSYTKNRYICFNIIQIQDINEYAKTIEIDGAILLLNF